MCLYVSLCVSICVSMCLYASHHFCEAYEGGKITLSFTSLDFFSKKFCDCE